MDIIKVLQVGKVDKLWIQHFKDYKIWLNDFTG